MRRAISRGAGRKPTIGTFCLEFDRVFNSYRLGKGKRDATIFDDTVCTLGVAPGEALFVDDNSGHVERAASRGLRAVLFRNQDRFLSGLGPLTGGKIVFR